MDILRWFVRRWRTETTFEEARRHLGVESQRQWSDLAILRTTPALLGLFSLVTLWASHLATERGPAPERVRWYPKPLPTFGERPRARPARSVDRAGFCHLPGRPDLTENPGRSARPPPPGRLPPAVTLTAATRASRRVQRYHAVGR